MGISSDGQICYGIAFEEGYELPWLDEKWDGDEEDWWFKGVCGYKTPFEIYNNQGEYIDGEKPSEEKIDEYYKRYSDFKKSNPLPVKIVRHCSYDYPMFIIAVIGTYRYASRGYPEKVVLTGIDTDKTRAVVDFCEKYCKPKDEFSKFPKMEPCWLLSSMYG